MSEAEAGEETLAESSLLSHLLELRDRLLRALIATAVIAVPCLYFGIICTIINDNASSHF